MIQYVICRFSWFFINICNVWGMLGSFYFKEGTFSDIADGAFIFGARYKIQKDNL